VGLGLRESNKDESVDSWKGAIFVFTKDKLLNRNIFNDSFFFGVLQTEIFKVKTLVDSFSPLRSTVGFCGSGFSCGLCGSLLFLLLFLLLFFVCFKASFIPFVVCRTILFRRRWVFDAKRDFKELHDPGQEFPRWYWLAVLNVLKFMFTHRDHAWAVLSDVVG
jgi:hypothetical protein